MDKIQNEILLSNDPYEIYEYARSLQNNCDVNKLADKVISLKDPETMYLFAVVIKDAPIKKILDAVISLGDAKWIYRILRDVKPSLLEDKTIDTNKNISIDDVVKSIISSGDTEYIYKTARDFDGVSIEELEDAVIESKNAQYIYYFARDVKKAKIDKLADAIIEINDKKYNALFSIMLKTKEKEEKKQADTKKYLYNLLNSDISTDEKVSKIYSLVKNKK